MPTDLNNIKLVLFGKTPENDKTMADLNIKSGDFMIMMILKPVQKKEEQKKEPVLNIEPKKEEVKNIEPKAEENKKEEHKEEPKKEEQKKEEPKKEEPKIDINQDSLNAMIAMGFDATLSSKALQMSSNNVDLAIDLISSGDLGFMPHPHPHQAQPKAQLNPVGHQEPQPHGQQPPNPQNQALLAALLAQLQSHPELIQGLQNNPGQLNSLLQQQQPQMVEIPAVLEQKDADAVARLKQLGLFTEQECKEAYFACGKSEDMAANYLLEGKYNADNGDNGGEMDEN